MEKHKQKNYTSAELKNFGLLVGGAFALIGLWPLLHGLPLRPWAGGIAATLILPAIVWPQSLAFFYRVWLCLAAGLGWFNTRLILTLLYFFAVLPVGMLLKALGKTPLQLSYDQKAQTYRELPEETSEGNFEEQF